MRPRYSSDRWRLRPCSRRRPLCTCDATHSVCMLLPPLVPPSFIAPILDESKALTAGEQLACRFHGSTSLVCADYLPAWSQPQPCRLLRASALSVFCICSSLRAPHCSLLSSFSLLPFSLAAFPQENSFFVLCSATPRLASPARRPLFALDLYLTGGATFWK